MTELFLRLFVRDYRNTADPTVRHRYGMLGSIFGLVTNLLLFVGKFTIGILLGFFSVVADSFNSLSDFGNNVLAVFGFRIAKREPDKEHPFGYQRIEYVISLVISCVIIGLGFVMLYQSGRDLYAFSMAMVETGHPPVEETLTYTRFVISLTILSIALFTKVVQSILYRGLAKRINSMPFRTLGIDALNDTVSTIVVIIGLVVSWNTSFKVDGFFTLAVALLIVVSGIRIMKESTDVLLGHPADKTFINKLIAMISKHPDVLGMHDLTMHYYGDIVYANIHIEVDARRDIMASHQLCDAIEREAETKYGINLNVAMDPVLVNDPVTEKYRDLVEKALQDYKQPISLHDFRVLSEPNAVNIIFDLVVPPELDTVKGHQNVSLHIQKYTDNAYGKPTHLVIDYDDNIEDFLAGTSAEIPEASHAPGPEAGPLSEDSSAKDKGVSDSKDGE
jgi:cation diffusion facilitator family transporter